MGQKKKQVKTLAEIEVLTLKPLEEYAAEFGVRFTAGLRAVQDAARLYAEAVRRYPSKAVECFRSRYPGVTEPTWDILLRIGNGDLHPTAIYLKHAIAKRVSRIPIANQERMFAESVKGFNVVDPATNRLKVVPIANLSIKEAELLIDEERGCVRSVEEQRRVIASRREADGTLSIAAKAASVPYRIVGSVLIVANVELGLETLRNIVGEIESNLGIPRR